MKVGELKAALKAAGMSAVGTKGALESRLALHKRYANDTSLRTADGTNPCSLSYAAIKSVAAREAEISPMLSHDEILEAFVQHLATAGGGGGGGGGGSGDSVSNGNGGAAAVNGGKVDANTVSPTHTYNVLPWCESPPCKAASRCG